jgi:proteasome beta subunit
MVEDKNIMKTGTTTLAMMCKDGIVLCADKRATAGYLIANKKVDKIVSVTDDIVVTTAGTVSDIQLLVKLLRAELKLKSIRTGNAILVKEAVNLLATFVYHNIRNFSAVPGITHFLVGGKDSQGFHIYDVGADGSLSDCDDFVSSGSGSVMAYGVLEAMYEKGITVDEAIKIGAKAINSAVQRDIASGNGIDIVTITKDGVKKVLSKEIDTRIII